MAEWKVIGKAASYQEAVKTILEARGLKTKKEIETFLNPSLNGITAQSLGIKKSATDKTVKRIISAIKSREQIIVYGDYDVDGICGTAILWETLNALGANVMPYIPHRMDEGYGLSVKGITNVKKAYENTKLIISVDNGIVASQPVDFANALGIEVIITDHHVPSKNLPKAFSIFHSTKICGTAVAWFLSSLLRKELKKNESPHDFLDLVTLATIADLMPLMEENRTLVKYGLPELINTKRVGLLELFKEAGIDKNKIGTYEIGHIIAPRLNAMGRLEHAMDSLRLVCTRDVVRARALADKLGLTNKQRQQLTTELVLHAKTALSEVKMTKKLIFISHETYQPGIIGLIAGRLVEEFYRPAIVLYKGELQSKASARSVSGFNIIEFIRQAEEFMVDAGGHPMAAGFTIDTANLENLQKKLEKLAEEVLTDKLLTRKLKIDVELPISLIDSALYSEVEKIAPFGMGNPQPTFLSRKVLVQNIFVMGIDKKHVKLRLSGSLQGQRFEIEAIRFGWAEKLKELRIGDTIDIVYTIIENEWNGSKKLELKIKDLKTTN